jgi:hypothetical protein
MITLPRSYHSKVQSPKSVETITLKQSSNIHATLCDHVQQLQQAFSHIAPDPRISDGLGRRLPQGARRAATPTALRRDLGQYREARWAGGVASPQASARPTDAQGNTQQQPCHSRMLSLSMASSPGKVQHEVCRATPAPCWRKFRWTSSRWGY